MWETECLMREIQDQGREDIQGFLYSKAEGHWALGNCTVFPLPFPGGGVVAADVYAHVTPTWHILVFVGSNFPLGLHSIEPCRS